MRIRVWGSRGTIASPGNDTRRYGGNTSCIEVRLDDRQALILDAGTGIRRLGNVLVEDPPRRIDVLISHLHVDHVEGLGVFGPIWHAGTELHVWGPASPVASLAERVAMYFSPPLFPVHVAEVPARLTFHDAPDGAWPIGEAIVRSASIQHQGATVGYRIEADGVVLAYLTDHEPALGTDLRTADPEWVSGATIAWEADLLIHDCQYTEEEYATRIGFGHSCPPDVAAFAEMVGARRLALFHHDPMHADDVVDAMWERVVRAWGVDPSRVEIAGDGAELAVAG